MDVSSDLLYRLLEIEVKSATFGTAADGSSFYVRISLPGKDLHHQVSLQTKPLPPKNGSVAWGQRFVFSVPESFISDEISHVFFTLVKARKLVSDVAMGQASCAVRRMFPVTDCLKYDGGGAWGTEYKEPEIQEPETFELRAAAEGAPVIRAADLYSAAAEVARLDFSVCAWRRYYPFELNLRGRLEKKYPIIDGADKLGKFTVRWPAAATESVPLYACSYFKVFNQVNLAMEFEELKEMLQRRRHSVTAAAVDQKAKPTKAPRRLLCFV